ncbi:MAG: hypothetical protein ACLS43_13305 [Evtepia gabavorous]
MQRGPCERPERQHLRQHAHVVSAQLGNISYVLCAILVVSWPWAEWVASILGGLATS